MERAARRVPARARALGRQCRERDPLRLLTSPLRQLPDFLIAGAMKCGTTSLYNYLGQHPEIAKARKKELHFFDWHYQRGLRWYRSQFPLALPGRWAGPGGGGIRTGEASTDYLFHPRAPERIAATLPEVRLIALLRNPVDRAYSHYHHVRKQGAEPLSFEDALAAEPQRLAGELDRLAADPAYPGDAYRRYSYLARGAYADGVERALNVLPRHQLLVVRSEDLFEEAAGAMAGVLAFLGLAEVALPSYPRLYAGSYRPMAGDTRAELIEHFRPHNRRLGELLGQELAWDV